MFGTQTAQGRELKMPTTRVLQEFRCTSCGYRQEVRVRPRGCPACHAPSAKRARWVDDVLAERLRSMTERVRVHA